VLCCPNSELSKLRAYLETHSGSAVSDTTQNHGTDNSSSTQAATTRPQTAAVMSVPPAPSIDGFHHAEALSRDEPEVLAGEFHSDEDELQSLLATKHEEPLFSDMSAAEEWARKLLLKKALLMRLLRGELPPMQTKGGSRTLGAALLGKHRIMVS